LLPQTERQSYACVNGHGDVLILSDPRTVVRECCNGDETGQWKRPNSTPRHTKSP